LKFVVIIIIIGLLSRDADAHTALRICHAENTLGFLYGHVLTRLSPRLIKQIRESQHNVFFVVGIFFARST
jgi:hypothetical protein